MTPAEARARIHELADELDCDELHSLADATQIARHFNVNPGRVSEALVGKRGEPSE